MSSSLLLVVVVVVVVDDVTVCIGFDAVINETKLNKLGRVVVTFVGNNVVFTILGAEVVTVDSNNVVVSIGGAVDVTVIGKEYDVTSSAVIAVLVVVVVVKLSRIRRSSGNDLHVNGIGASWSSGFYINKHNYIKLQI